jgi:Arc/MetJ-type ribon-helix-helix transcriptional regulator
MAISWHTSSVAYALAKENEAFIKKMLKLGRFNNQSEVVREALRRMEREENSYLNPPPLTDEERRQCFAPNPEEDAKEHALVKASQASIRRSIRKNKLNFDDL